MCMRFPGSGSGCVSGGESGSEIEGALPPLLEHKVNLPFSFSSSPLHTAATNDDSHSETTCTATASAVVAFAAVADPIFNLNLDGALSRELKDSKKKKPSKLRVSLWPFSRLATARQQEHSSSTSLKPLPPAYWRRDDQAPLARQPSIPQLYLTSTFPDPEHDMVSGRSPASAWQAVASRVVIANRRRRGLGKSLLVEDFKIEELGGGWGPLVFGPVAVFNGNILMRVKKPLKSVTLTVAFHGVTEVDKSFVPFFIASRDIFTGDLQDGLRSFLFGFSFPHINLPPTSVRPFISYSFLAKLSIELPTNLPAEGSSVSQGSNSELLEYRSMPLRIDFIPYVDPALETPLVSRKPSMRKRKPHEKHPFKRPITPSTPTIDLGSTAPSPKPTNPKMRGPKLTLTTADISSTASSNSTPVIDKPHPSVLSSAITRTTRITDAENNTIAKLTVEMPASRFLPGEDIVMRLTLQIREGMQPPKGLGARVVESRCLASEKPGQRELESHMNDEEHEPPKMEICGKESFRVLTSKKFLLRHNNMVPIQETGGIRSNNSAEAASEKQDTGLVGGRELVEMMMVTLPPFQTFIADSLLPTSMLPLGDPKLDEPLPESPILTDIPPKIVFNGKGKYAVSDNISIRGSPSATKVAHLYFKVAHFVQITIPMNGPSMWFKLGINTVVEDLDVTVPIIIGNKNPNKSTVMTPKYSLPEVRLNTPDNGSTKRVLLFGNGEGASSMMTRSSRSNSKSSGSDGRAPTIGTTGSGAGLGWKHGEKFLTLRETSLRPEFVRDL